MVMKALTTAKILRTIADEKSMGLFRTIFQTGGIDSESLQGKTKLTRKEYYTRLAGMVKAGLVMKTDGRYTLTAFGNVVYNSQMMVENGITNFWKLKAIDSLSMSKELPKEEQQKVADKLLKDQEIKEIIRK
jgi:predicted transcriptional regulator